MHSSLKISTLSKALLSQGSCFEFIIAWAARQHNSGRAPLIWSLLSQEGSSLRVSAPLALKIK